MIITKKKAKKILRNLEESLLALAKQSEPQDDETGSFEEIARKRRLLGEFSAYENSARLIDSAIKELGLN